MKASVEIGSKLFKVDFHQGKSIGIVLDFDGPQPNHFGVESAERAAIDLGSFVGDTRRGGSCNVDRIQLIPHCNGTHTETVGHIVNNPVPISSVLTNSLVSALLLSVTPIAASGTSENYRPVLDASDLVITAGALQEQLAQSEQISDAVLSSIDALIIRTLPNEATKQNRHYGQQYPPAFLTVDATELINQWSVKHLLVDFPSLDRLYDDGLLTNHHLFWNVVERTHDLSPQTRRDKTITEMIFVPDSIDDGRYLLNLQVSALSIDAAPSRPVLYALEEA